MHIRDMCPDLLMTVVTQAFDGLFPDYAVYPLNLTVFVHR